MPHYSSSCNCLLHVYGCISLLLGSVWYRACIAHQKGIKLLSSVNYYLLHPTSVSFSCVLFSSCFRCSHSEHCWFPSSKRVWAQMLTAHCTKLDCEFCSISRLAITICRRVSLISLQEKVTTWSEAWHLKMYFFAYEVQCKIETRDAGIPIRPYFILRLPVILIHDHLFWDSAYCFIPIHNNLIGLL